jgi:hypothetical protein
MTAVSQPANTRRRGPGRPWPKGVSGNPTGQPKDIAAAVAECRRLALSHVPRAVAKLAELLNSEDERVVAAAATALMDRAGVAPRSWEGEHLEVVASVDPAALRSLLEARLARLAKSRAIEEGLAIEPIKTNMVEALPDRPLPGPASASHPVSLGKQGDG